jgi:transcriptional regulator with XRE-family HTH domain
LVKTIVCVPPIRSQCTVEWMRRLEISDAFATVLKQRRKAKGLSQEALAEKADLHPTYIGLVERSLRNPSLNAAQAMAQALGASLSKLLAEAESIQKTGNA